jgi:hypothetical protein
MDRSEAAPFPGSLPKSERYERTCPICGKVFATNARGIYCNPLCGAKAQTRHKTAARRERREQEATTGS